MSVHSGFTSVSEVLPWCHKSKLNLFIKKDVPIRNMNDIVKVRPRGDLSEMTT